MAHLKVGLLGSLQITLADKPVTKLESVKARALLAYLAVEADRPHRRDALVGLLWPDCPEETARHNLRQTLFNVRQAIGDAKAKPPFLFISRDDIQFNPASDSFIDAVRFSALCNSGSAPLTGARLAELEEAVALYRAKFLQEFFLEDSAGFEEWALMHRETWHQQALEALAQLGAYYEQQDDLAAARRHVARQLELDPWREEAHRQMMRVLARQGQATAALVQYETCRRVLADELGVEPSADTVALYEQIREGKVAAVKVPGARAVVRVTHSLPTSLTPFIGRERELAELERLLADPACRCISIVGPGGIGKTRLAVQVATRIKTKFGDGAAFVPLAPVDSMGSIPLAIANAVELPFSGPLEPRTQLLNYMRGKEMLLVLDNVEHLLDGVPLYQEVLEQAPAVKLLVTSREPLNLLGEWLFEVGGLDLPKDETEESFERSSAVGLFMQRARRAHVGLALDKEDRRAVAEIARLVNGTPLAIELAACWVQTLSPKEIVQEIERGLDFLATNLRDLPERHRSMRAVFDHSWRLLNAQEQRVLARLSIFRGGMQREAAEKIAGAPLPLLSSLLAKSLLRRVPIGRYDLHELVRQYAADRLHEMQDEEDATCVRHSAYYTDFASDREQPLKGKRQLEASAELAAEMDNIRSAWRHAVLHRHFDAIAKPLRAFYSLLDMRGWNAEGQAMYGWAAAELQTGGDAQLHAEPSFQILLAFIQAAQGWCCITQGKRELARQLLESSTVTLRRLGAKIELVQALHDLGILDWQDGNYVQARALFVEEHELATQLQDPWEMALATGTIAMTDQMLGEHRQALDQYQAALAAFRSLGDERLVAAQLFYIGGLEWEMGMPTAARDSLRESVQLSRNLGDRWVLGMALSALGMATQGASTLQEIAALFEESLNLFQQTGERWSTIETLNRLGNVMLNLNAVAQARIAFLDALKLAREIELMPGQMEALVGIAEVRAKKGQDEPALLILTKVLEEPTLSKLLRGRAEDLRQQLEQRMTADEVRSVQEQARTTSMDALIRELEGISLEPFPVAYKASP